MASTIKILIDDNALGLNRTVDSGISADLVHLRCRKSSQVIEILLWYVVGGSVYRTVSRDEGANWEVATAIGTGTQVTGLCTKDGRIFTYLVDAGDVKVQIEDADFNVLTSLTTVLSGVDDASIAFDESFLAEGKHRFLLWVVLSGVVTRYLSTNGVDFT